MADVACCPDRDDLQRFLVGRLPEADTQRLQRHLAGCPSCVDSLHTLEVADSLIEAMRFQGNESRRTEDAVVAGLIARLSGLGPPGAPPPVDGPAPAQPAVAGYEILGVLGRGG